MADWDRIRRAQGTTTLELDDGTWIEVDVVGGTVLKASPELTDLVELGRVLWWPTVQVGKPLEFTWTRAGMSPPDKVRTHTKANYKGRRK
jgi:hypothetical protein